MRRLRLADEPFKRLVGWQRVELGPGETKTVTVAVDPRVMSVFDEKTDECVELAGAELTKSLPGLRRRKRL